jgi:endothelin-converting enzyme
MQKFLVSLFILALFVACSKQPKSGIDKSGMDTSVRPQDDLYEYVNGSWLETTEIPADRSNYGAFTQLVEQSEENLKVIVEEAAYATDKEQGSEAQKVGDFYLSFMDTNRIEALRREPLKEDLNRIKSVQTREELAEIMAYFQKINVQTPFGFWINQDFKNTDQYIIYLTQSGLGLPDRDYYFKYDDHTKKVREAYLKYIEGILTGGGIEDVQTKAIRIMEMETELATGHWTRVENRDRNKTYNKYTIQMLKDETPEFSWAHFLEYADLLEQEELIVRQPSYLEQFNRVFKKYSVNEWKNYLTFKLIRDTARFLSQDFVNLNFNFYGKTLSGIQEIRPRWKRAIDTIEEVMGEAIGKIYVQKHFRPEAKERMVELVENLRSAYAERINQLDWMSPETKKEALDKLSKFTPKIGYPDKWEDYSKLIIEKDQLLQNYLRGAMLTYEREISKLGKPVDRQEWFIYPQTVNAYYNPAMNEVVFPAAILQPPFFNMAADDAVNYGAIGAVIGHEMTHGFDDQGRKSDGKGILRDWWTEEDEKRFMERADVLVKHFEQFVLLDSLHLNGQLTLGENIADLGGLTIAYYAYQQSLGDREAPVIDGWTGEQRFFMGWAQVWRRKYREEELRKRILTDPHSPSRYRVIGIVPNMPEFYAAFNVTQDDELYLPPGERAEIW